MGKIAHYFSCLDLSEIYRSGFELTVISGRSDERYMGFTKSS